MLQLISSLAAVALMMVALPASPAEWVELPAEMLGTWCLQQEGKVLTRGDCLDEADSWLLIGRDGYQGHEFGCKTIKSNVDRSNQPRGYVLESRCEGEAQTWDAIISIWLGPNDSLIVRIGDASRPREQQ